MVAHAATVRATFYYFEPDSEYILFSPYTLVATDKISTCLTLGVNFDDVVNIIYEKRKDWDIENGENPDIAGYPSYMGFDVSGDTKYEQWYNVVKGIYDGTIDLLKYQPEYYPYFRDVEDAYDDILCKTAANSGLTCVILKHMISDTRLVTEVLDVRSRKESFSNLYFPPLL